MWSNLLSIFFVLVLSLSASAQSQAPTVSQPTEAFYIHPMELFIRPDARKFSTLEVFNKEAQSAKIHVDVFERSDTVEGTETRALTKDVTVDAQDFTLAAGQSRKLNIRYRGSKKLKRERAYRIIVRQVAPGETNSLDVRFVYVASMYVTPELAEPKLVVRQVSRASDRELEVLLANEGGAHAELAGVRFVVLEEGARGSKREISLSSESRDDRSRQNLLAGSQRKLKFQIAASEPPISTSGLTVNLVKQAVETR